MSGLETINIRAVHQCGRNPQIPPFLYPSQHEMTEYRLSRSIFSSPKPPLFIKDVPPASVSVAAESTSIPSSPKAAAFHRAFEHTEVNVEHALPISTSATASISPSIKRRWARYPGKSPCKMAEQCLWRLKELYDTVKASKKLKRNCWEISWCPCEWDFVWWMRRKNWRDGFQN